MTDRLDIAIIGSGPAGLSAAINARVRGKSFKLFGHSELSTKLSSAHGINNYLGMFGKTGAQMAEAFKEHLAAMTIELTEETITTIYPSEGYYMLLTKEGTMYEATAVILATGVNFGKPLPGERELLGRGVSYCATCDAFAYKGKVAAVIGFNKRDEAEAAFLAETAAKVYYIPMYKEPVQLPEAIELVQDQPVAIIGKERVTELQLRNTTLQVEGVFLLRESVAADQLVPGIKAVDSHVQVDRLMATNLPGCFAAGDIVGMPYQYIKAAGEGNIAALSAAAYVDSLKRQEKTQ